MAKSLTGLNVLVTRPERQAQSLHNLIREAGGKSFLFPALAITYLNNQSLLTQTVASLKIAQTAIFLSANAVGAIVELLKAQRKLLLSLNLLAIGEGTRQALNSIGVEVSFFPGVQASSEGLLGLPILQEVAGQTIIIFKGEGGRTILSSTLKERGADIIEVLTYRRECPSPCAANLIATWQDEQVNTVIITSAESLNNLFILIADKQWLMSLTFIVISARIAQQVKALGINNYIIAANASEAALVEALKSAVVYRKNRNL